MFLSTCTEELLLLAKKYVRISLCGLIAPSISYGDSEQVALVGMWSVCGWYAVNMQLVHGWYVVGMWWIYGQFVVGML